MYSFRNDYSEGAHPRILNVLASTNLDQSDGYGEDSFSLEARFILTSKMQLGIGLETGAERVVSSCLNS